MSIGLGDKPCVSGAPKLPDPQLLPPGGVLLEKPLRDRVHRVRQALDEPAATSEPRLTSRARP